MGNCCARAKLVRNRMTLLRRRRIVLMLVGLDNSGKTATAKELLREKTQHTVPTIGFSSHNLSFKGYSVIIYDVGGGPQIRDIWKQYYADVHGIIYVIDASDTSRINESCSVLHQLLTHDKLKGKPLLLLANKQDVEGALDEIDIVERLNLEAIVNQQRCPTLVETCCAVPPPNHSKLRKAYLDPGIQNGFRWILSIIIKDYQTLNSRVETDTKAAQAQLILERENRRKRIEEQRRQREEMEGTVIIPLRDSSPESVKSRIINVQSVNEGTQKVSSVETIHPSDSQDSGYTVQNEDADKDGDSLSTIKSKDSAVQSMHKERVEGSTASIGNEEEQKPKVVKKKNWIKRSNRTAPADAPLDAQTVSRISRQKLPPLTPPPKHIKMFEAKSARRGRLTTSMSLSFEKSESELTDEERSLNFVSFPSDWKLLRHQNGTEVSNATKHLETENGFGKTFIVSSTTKVHKTNED